MIFKTWNIGSFVYETEARIVLIKTNLIFVNLVMFLNCLLILIIFFAGHKSLYDWLLKCSTVNELYYVHICDRAKTIHQDYGTGCLLYMDIMTSISFYTLWICNTAQHSQDTKITTTPIPLILPHICVIYFMYKEYGHNSMRVI